MPREKVNMVEKIKVEINPIPTLRVNRPAVIEVTRRVLENLAGVDRDLKPFGALIETNGDMLSVRFEPEPNMRIISGEAITELLCRVMNRKIADQILGEDFGVSLSRFIDEDRKVV